MRRYHLFLIAFLLAFSFSPLAAYARGFAPRPEASSYTVRVMLLSGEKDSTLDWSAGCRVYVYLSDELLMRPGGAGSVSLRAYADGVVWAKKEIPVFILTIIPEAHSTLRLNNKPYRGSFVIASDGETLTVTNKVGLEDYLCGVLPMEVPYYWPRQALEAQAITARTYALYTQRFSLARGYDLTTDESSQVYGGIDAEKRSTTRAVRHTRGEVVVYDKALLPAFFHSSCGGHTESAREVWDIDIPPLAGKKSAWCMQAPHFAWQRKLSLKEVHAALARDNASLAPLVAVEIMTRTASGRVKRILLITTRGVQEITGRDFRAQLGASLIKSTLFDITQEKDILTITGTGWGHGVGLCQWGAKAMALKHHSARDILNHFYPGTEIVDLTRIN